MRGVPTVGSTRRTLTSTPGPKPTDSGTVENTFFSDFILFFSSIYLYRNANKTPGSESQQECPQHIIYIMCTVCEICGSSGFRIFLSTHAHYTTLYRLPSAAPIVTSRKRKKNIYIHKPGDAGYVRCARPRISPKHHPYPAPPPNIIE